MLTTDYVPGAPNWLDLGTPDTEAAARFYGALFGWEFQSAGPEAGGYGFFTLQGETVAAVGLLEEDAKPAWTLYFDTPDADAAAKAVVAAGGTVRFEPFDVFTNGRMAGFTDPTGAQFAVWQPSETKGLDAVTKVNSLCWTELYTADAAKAKAFYASVFGWGAEDMPVGGMTYSIVTPSGGGPSSALGGIMEMGADALAGGLTSRWQPYFEVSDCDVVTEVATGSGATLVMGPETMEGVGRMAQLIDPFGAPFAVIKSVDPAAA